MTERETWRSRLGFILAAVGSAVGLGNIWRFPFQTAEGGGAAFLIVYLLFVIGIGFSAMLAEFVIGRRTGKNPVNAFQELGRGKWKLVGGLGVFTAFVIVSYYSVVAGWVLRYFLGSFTGAYFAGPGTYFSAISAGMDAILFHILFMILAAGIVITGVREGIEKTVKFMVPGVVLLLLGLAFYSFGLPEASQGYKYYLSPDFSTLISNAASVLPDAAGQAFFTLSLGMGVMITYASYLGEDENLGIDGISIVATNTFISFLAGLVVFPILFTIGISPETSGPSAIFVAVAQAISQLPSGELLGAVFFGTVAIAALSSAISLLEVVVSFLIENYSLTRTQATVYSAAVMLLLGIPTALNNSILTLYDVFAANILLLLGGLSISLFVGWKYSEEAVEEIQNGIENGEWLSRVWIWLLRIPVPIALFMALILAVQEFLKTAGEII